jgi:hypothetical protein
VGFVMPGATTGNISLTTAGGSVSSGSNFTVSAPQAITTQTGNKVSGNDNIGAAFQGLPIALSANGNTAIIGGNDDNSGQGAAWVFTKVNGFWSQQGSKLIGTGNIGAASQGISVALSADGNTAMIGGYYDNTGQGAAWADTVIAVRMAQPVPLRGGPQPCSEARWPGALRGRLGGPCFRREPFLRLQGGACGRPIALPTGGDG